MNLLIVDDTAQNRKLLRAQLEAEGHVVLEAANGAEALYLLSQKSADCVISDILMPVMDGFRLCQELRGNPQHASLPVVLYTSTYDSPSDRSLADSVGADVYLLKPAPTAEILAAVSQAQCNVAGRTSTAATVDETYVLKEYNAALVRKLEERNLALQDLNRTLETRVTQRTADLDATNKDLEAFAYSVSHDLRAPLRHIAAFAQLLEESVRPRLTAQESAHLGRILQSATQMDQLISALLDFSRTARAEMRLAPVELESLLDEVLDIVRIEARGRDVHWRIAPLPRVRGDRALLRQVFVNLLSNAIKYTRGRTPAIIEIGHRPDPGEAVVFIRDNGVGFDMRRAQRLFNVFGRLHPDSEFEGSGIGLVNAERIVARHGGRMWAEATPGKGATFYLTLPAT